MAHELLDSPVQPSRPPVPSLKTQQNDWFLSNFLRKAIFFVVLIALLPVFPPQAPESLNENILTRSWELLHLLFVGIAISYGLFSRRNAYPDVEKEAPWKPDTPQSYVSRILHVSSVFDDEEETETVPLAAFDESNNKVQTWSSQYYRGDPVVVVAEGANNGGHESNEPLSLPVRRLKSPAPAEDPNKLLSTCRNETHQYIGLSNGWKDESGESIVLPSPIPWRSRSGRMEVKEESSRGTASPPYILPPSVMEANVIASASSLRKTQSFRAASSPNKLSRRSSSPSPEFRAKSSEDIGRKKSFYKAAPPPAPPPPPPPPPFVHGSLAFSDRRNTERSFKEELKDFSRNGRERSLHGNDSGGINSLKLETSLKNQTGGGSALGKSVRTLRSKDQVQDSETSLERVVGCENRQPPPLPRSQSARKNEYFTEKVIVASDDFEDDDDDDVGEISDAEDVPNSGAGPDENEVDKKADEFIAKFREQIRLQRIASIKRSTGERKVRSPK